MSSTPTHPHHSEGTRWCVWRENVSRQSTCSAARQRRACAHIATAKFCLGWTLSVASRRKVSIWTGICSISFDESFQMKVLHVSRSYGLHAEKLAAANAGAFYLVSARSVMNGWWRSTVGPACGDMSCRTFHGCPSYERSIRSLRCSSQPRLSQKPYPCSECPYVVSFSLSFWHIMADSARAEHSVKFIRGDDVFPSTNASFL